MFGNLDGAVHFNSRSMSVVREIVRSCARARERSVAIPGFVFTIEALVTVAEWLASAGAQRDVVAWAESFGHDWDAMWTACPRGDWLLALAVRRGENEASIAAAARKVATLALDHVGDERAMLERALAEPTAERATAIESLADASIDPAHQAALMAIALATRGTREDAAMVPAFVVQAAAMDAVDCGMSAAVSYAQRRSAELVREVFPTITSPYSRTSSA
jgi:hypothetical protein